MSSNKEDYTNWQLNGDEPEEKEIHIHIDTNDLAKKYAEVVVPAMVLGKGLEFTQAHISILKAIFISGYTLSEYSHELQEELVLKFLQEELKRDN